MVTAYGFSEWPTPQEDSPEMRPCNECAKNIFFVNNLKGIADWYDGLEEQLRNQTAGKAGSRLT